MPLALSVVTSKKSLELLAWNSFGQTVTYGQIAKDLQVAAQAIGGAVGRNPVYPCPLSP